MKQDGWELAMQIISSAIGQCGNCAARVKLYHVHDYIFWKGTK